MGSEKSTASKKAKVEPNEDGPDIELEIVDALDTNMGRPLKPIDIENLDGLCELQCSLVEIASFFKCHPRTVERRLKKQFNITFAEYFDLKSGRGRISIKRTQFQIAKGEREVIQDGQIVREGTEPSERMLIHLGKTVCGQNEKNIIEHSGRDGGDIRFRNASDEDLADSIFDMAEALKTLQKFKKTSSGEEE